MIPRKTLKRLDDCCYDTRFLTAGTRCYATQHYQFRIRTSLPWGGGRRTEMRRQSISEHDLPQYFAKLRSSLELSEDREAIRQIENAVQDLLKAQYLCDSLGLDATQPQQKRLRSAMISLFELAQTETMRRGIYSARNRSQTQTANRQTGYRPRAQSVYEQTRERVNAAWDRPEAQGTYGQSGYRPREAKPTGYSMQTLYPNMPDRAQVDLRDAIRTASSEASAHDIVRRYVERHAEKLLASWK